MVAWLVASAPAGATIVPEVRFASPAQVGGDVSATGASWALVLTSPGHATHLALSGASRLERVEHELVAIGEHRIPRGGFDGWTTERDIEGGPLPSNVTFRAEEVGQSSFFLEGRLAVEVQGAYAAIELPPGQCIDWLLEPEESRNQTTRADKLCPDSWPAVAFRAPPGATLEYRLAGYDVQRSHWHNMQSSCTDATACPPGGSQEDVTVQLTPGDYLRTRRHLFEDAQGPPSAQASAAGQAQVLLLGGVSFDLMVSGWVRLPLATGSAGCPDCLAPVDQTFSASGEILLAGLQRAPGGGLQSSLTGDFATARFDEQPIDPRLLQGTTAVAAIGFAAGLTVLAKAFLASFFTRRTDEETLLHERRRLLYDFVVGNPGVHFREALRGAALPSGAGRHHVTQLVRAGLLVERRIGSKLRLFPAGADSVAWQEVAVARNPNLRALHEWITVNPGRNQMEILEAFREGHGWSPSTTQGRLVRLAREGVLAVEDRGRYRHYRALHPANLAVAPDPLAMVRA